MRRPKPGFICSPLGATLFVCLLLLAVSLGRWERGHRPNFPLEHSNVAYSLASGSGYANPFSVASGPTAWVPPAIPFLYAGAIESARVLRIDERAPIVGLNVVAAASAVYLILRFCLLYWTLGSRIVFCAAFLGYSLLDPDFLVSSGPLTAGESALLLAALTATARNPGTWGPWAMVFLANALLSVTHPGLALAGVLATVAAGLPFVRAHVREPAALVKSAWFAALAGVALAAGPWTIRNRVVFHQWIPAKSNGYFELVHSQDDTENGVLTDASMAGHPATNPRILTEYVRLGERAFLDSYRRRADEILRTDFSRYCAFCANRLLDAIWFGRTPVDIEMLSVRLPSAQAAKLVGRRLIIMCAGTPNFFWARNPVPASAELASLQAAGIDEPELVLADWVHAQETIRSRMESLGATLTSFAWSGFPTLCCAAALLAGGRSAPRLVFATAAVYLVALVPNILITHDMNHQGSFMLLFAVLSAGAVESIARRVRGGSPNPPVVQHA
jgi:hypothetical protein